MLKLTGSKIAIQAVFDPDKTPGGLYIPDIAKERCDQGIVKYIGPKVRDLKVGDYVLFGGYDGTTIRLEGEGVLILMREQAVKCIIGDIGTDVPGLYFKARPDLSKLEAVIRDNLTAAKFNSITVDKGLQDITLAVASFVNQAYYLATYEQAIDLCTDAMQEIAIPHKNLYSNREEPETPYDEDEDDSELRSIPA